jgi:hypothetical protein
VWGGLAKLIGWLFGKLCGVPPVSAEQQLGQAKSQVAQEAQANDQLQVAARARAAADAQRVRDGPHAGDVTTDPNAAINRNPDNHFRD